jgi:hypothetical protein
METHARARRVRAVFWLLAVIFVVLRLVDLGSVYVWIDDVHSFTYTNLDPTPWSHMLGDSFQHSLDTTGPFFPTLVLKVINTLVGPHVLALRLPALIVGALSFLMLYLVLSRLFNSMVARVLPLFLFTFSVPSIIYSQAIQPSIYYFLSSAVQLYLFVGLVADLKPYTPTAKIFRKLQIFALVSTLLFFVNFMSVLIYGLLVGCYVLMIGIMGRKQSGVGRKLAVTILNAVIVTIPLMILALLRARSGDVSRPYFEGLYYLDSPGAITRIPRLVYDLLTYHFNFAYDPALYVPRGDNLLALPFVLLVLAGTVYFFARRRWALIPFAFASAVILAAAAFKLMPFGGLRHSLTLAPFLYVAAGYGVEAIHAAAQRSSPRLARVAPGLVALLAAFALLTFVLSGVHLYADRKATLNIHTIHELAGERQVVGYCETYLILGVMGEDSELSGLGQVCADQPPDSIPTPYLLVDYRRTFYPDPSWPVLAWDPVIPREMFAGKRITPLIQEIGPLDPHTMGVQSIYYPMNGFFVYLIESGE